MGVNWTLGDSQTLECPVVSVAVFQPRAGGECVGVVVEWTGVIRPCYTGPRCPVVPRLVNIVRVASERDFLFPVTACRAGLWTPIRRHVRASCISPHGGEVIFFHRSQLVCDSVCKTTIHHKLHFDFWPVRCIMFEIQDPQ